MNPKEAATIKREFVASYPFMSTRALARKMAGELPNLFDSIEKARNSIRYYRKEKGIESASQLKKSSQAPCYKYRSPASAESEYAPFILPPVGNGLVIGDVHLPYHDQRSLDTAIDHAQKIGATEHLLILGDLMDFYQLSQFSKDPRKFCVESEIEMATKFLGEMTKIFAAVYYKAGNHEQRLQTFIYRNAPALAGLPGLDMIEMLKMSEMGVRYVPSDVPIYAGDNLTLIHGHEYGQRMYSPVNAARGLFIKALACSIAAHGHRTSHHDEPDIRGRDISTWSIGCLCDLHPEYARLNKWNHGFGLLDFEGGDEWDFINCRIVNGRVR